MDVHTKVPHVYVIFWPEHSVMKIGMSKRSRWNKWRSYGAVEIAAVQTCCMEHAHRIEQRLLGVLKQVGSQAFAGSNQAKHLPGVTGNGFSECYVLPRPPSRDAPLDAEDDFCGFETVYGLALPEALRRALDSYDLTAWFEADGGLIRRPR